MRISDWSSDVCSSDLWFPNFRLSIDYYDIKVAGAIDISASDMAMQICRAGTNPGICTIGTDESGNPDRVLALYATYQNLNALRARGVEVVSTYNQDLSAISNSLSGDLTIVRKSVVSGKSVSVSVELG